MHIADLKVPQTWTKLVDLIDLGREKFEIDENKDYYLHNKSDYILYAAESEGVPTEETPEIRIYGGQSAGYIKATGDLYVCSKLPDLYPYPATISVIFSDDVAATNAIAIGNYKPETDVRGAYVYRGSVADRDALPKEGMEIGDVYNLEDTGMNVAWTGKLWDELGGTFSVDLTGYAKKADVDAEFVKVNEALETKATKEEVTEALAAKAEATDVTALEEKVDANTQAIAAIDTSAYATKEELANKADTTALDAKADKTELANYATTEAMNAALEAKAAKADFDELKAAAVTYKDYTLEDQPRRGIELANQVNIVGIDTNGEGNSLVMLSKWDVADFGSAKVHCNLNTKDMVTINDKEAVLTNENANQFIQQGNGISITQKELTYPDTEIKYHVLEVASTVDTANFATKDELTAKADTSALDAYATTEAMNSALANKADTSALANYVTTEANTEALELKADAANVYTKAEVYTKGEVDAKVASVYRYKGVVDSEASLPQEDNAIGDVWNVEDTGANYSWDGSVWDKLSETINLTPYQTKEEAASTYATKDELNAKADKSTSLAGYGITDAYTKAEVDGKFATKEQGAKADTAVQPAALDAYVKTETATSTYATKEELANKADTSALAAKADTSALEALQQQIAELTARVEALESPAA